MLRLLSEAVFRGEEPEEAVQRLGHRGWSGREVPTLLALLYDRRARAEALTARNVGEVRETREPLDRSRAKVLHTRQALHLR
jgi:hypothetical protein